MIDAVYKIPGGFLERNGRLTGRFICFHYNLKKKFRGHQSFVVGPLIPLFLTSGDIFSGFQSQGQFPNLHASLPGYLRFTSGVTPADLLVASMAAKLFHPLNLHTSIGGA